MHGKTGHVVVDAEDALVAALKVKLQRPEALITYVRHQNERGDSVTLGMDSAEPRHRQSGSGSPAAQFG